MHITKAIKHEITTSQSVTDTVETPSKSTMKKLSYDQCTK
uniref:Uncharacterized protein n=1 Tax=Rhizophora mucronata TaxID=61149 RepID=A0A2P2JE85_RHIMU